MYPLLQFLLEYMKVMCSDMLSEEEITSQLENLDRVLQKFTADPGQYNNEDALSVFTE